MHEIYKFFDIDIVSSLPPRCTKPIWSSTMFRPSLASKRNPKVFECSPRFFSNKATTGQMGVLPGHVPATAELKHGILSIHESNDATKYFLSSGFAFIRANSIADIAAPVERIEESFVQKGLAEFSQKLSSAVTDLEKAEAQIGSDVQSALNAALAG